MSGETAPERASGLTLIRGGRAAPQDVVARLRDLAGDGPVTQDMLEFAQYLADQANDALAAALRWRDALGETVTVATYDRKLWRAARVSGLVP